MSQRPETREELAARLELEEKCKKLGKRIRKMLPPQIGFTLLTFDYADGERTGNMAYMSTAVREDMVEALHEFLGKVGGGVS